MRKSAQKYLEKMREKYLMPNYKECDEYIMQVLQFDQN